MNPITLTRDLTAQGFSSDEIARKARSGDLQRIRRGAYALPTPGEVAGDRDAHRLLLEATLPQTSPEAVVSHLSAAVLHGLPIWADGLARVHLTRDRVTGAKVGTYLHLHSGSLAPEDVTEIEGIRVTTLARTVVDVGRSMPFLRSVPIGDAALAAGLEPDELDRAITRAARRSGIGAARRMAAFADGHSESVGESTSRVVFFQLGVVPTDLQYEVFDPAMNLVGRTDFCWEDRRTLGEFDGKVKYGRLLMPGQSAADVVYAEKLREDRLRDLGWEVVRWTWDDLRHPERLLEKLKRAFARGRRRA